MSEVLTPEQQDENARLKNRVYIGDMAVKAYDENLYPHLVANDRMRAEHERDQSLNKAADIVEENLDGYIETARQEAEEQGVQINLEPPKQ